MTARSASSSCARATTASGSDASSARVVARAAIPALPGPHTNAVTDGSRLSARTSACSRAPEPTTRTLTDADASVQREQGDDMESAILLAVPEAEPLVHEWRAKGDPSAAHGVPAHVTLLYPFLPVEAIDVGVTAELDWFFRGI